VLSRQQNEILPGVPPTKVAVTALLGSARTSETHTSMIDPGGAVNVTSVDPAFPFCQKPDKDNGAGLDCTCAGVDTDTDVSVISREGLLLLDGHKIEQVTAAPWDAGGVQISILLSLTVWKIPLAEVPEALLQATPHAAKRVMSVIIVAVADELVKRN